MTESGISKSPKNTLKSEHGLRFLACLLVMLAHSRVVSVATSLNAVSVFFILSGFLLVYNHHGESLSCSVQNCFRFAVRHIRKLYPLYLVTLVICIPFSVTGINVRSMEILFSCIFLVQAWIPDITIAQSLNGVGWFISVSFFLYMMFPLINQAINQYQKKSTAIIMIGIIFLIQIIAVLIMEIPALGVSWESKYYLTYICPIFRLGCFAIGCNAGYLFIYRDESNKSSVLLDTIVECIEVIIVLFTWYCWENYTLFAAFWTIPGIRYVLLFTLESVILIFILAYSKGYISKLLSTNMFGYLGDMSVHLFIIHYPVITWINTYINLNSIQNTNLYLICCIGLIITFLGSFCYAQFVSLLKTYSVS